MVFDENDICTRVMKCFSVHERFILAFIWRCEAIREISIKITLEWAQKQFVMRVYSLSWWRHQMETFSALLAICAGNSPASGEFPTQRPVTRSFDVYFDLRPDKRLSKQSLGWWFETLSSSLWRQCNVIALWWWFCPCRVGGAVWNHTAWLFPLMPLPTLSLFYSYFLFGNEYRKTSLEKKLGNFSFVSIYYHWNWFEDLHHVQGIEIKDDSEMLHSQYLRENNGTTCHHGHPADCQLALTNVVEVQTKVVTTD